MVAWITKTQSVGFARQSAFETEATTSFKFIRSAVSIASRPREVEQLDYATGQHGAQEAPHVDGGAGGEITLSFALEGCKVGYDASSEAPVTTSDALAYTIALIANHLGSDGSGAVSSAANFSDGTHLYSRGYQANDVSAAPGGKGVTMTTIANYNEGEFFVSQTNEDGALPCVGWVSDVNTTPNDLQLRETPANQPVPSDDVLGVAVAYLSSAARVPFTLRSYGDNDGFLEAFVGCTHKSLKLSFFAKKVPMVEMTIRYSKRKEYSTGGKLQAVTAFQRIAPVVGDNGGLLVYGTGGSGAATCGWHELELTIDYGDGIPIDCHGKMKGEASVELGEPEISLTAKIPVDSGDTITSGENPFETLLTNGTAKSITGIVGSNPGSIFSFTLPAMHLNEAVEIEDMNGLRAYSTKWTAGRYSADTGSTAPADALVALGWC